MKKSLTVGVLVALGFAILPIESAPQRSSQQAYAMAMDGWEKDEKALIAPSAKELIASGFERHQGELAYLGGDQVWRGSDRTLKQTLVVYYLSDLRDLKTGGWSPNRSPSLPMAGNRGMSEVQGSGINSSDVQGYSVDEFFARIKQVLKEPKGELHVVSKPSGGSITLDNVKRGYTEKITVERAGNHSIVVAATNGAMRCEDKVVVPANGSVTFHCP